MSDAWTVEPILRGTGWSSTCTLLTGRDARGIVDTGLSIQEGELVAALRARGVAPGDVDFVINTHLHLDHCSNNCIFPRARIYLSEAEWRWTDAFYSAIFATRTPEQAALPFYPELPSHNLPLKTIRNVARMVKLFWTRERVGEERFHWLETSALPGGLTVLQTPGHTPHHISLRVAGPVPVLIAGDAVLAEDAAARVRTMIPHNRVQFLATRQALLDQGGVIVPGHGAMFTAHPEPGATSIPRAATQPNARTSRS